MTRPGGAQKADAEREGERAKKYEIAWKQSAVRDIKGLTKRIREQVNGSIQGLADNPHPPGSGPLGHGFRGLERLDSGDYCIVYRIDEKPKRRVLIVIVRNRKDVYARLKRMLGIT